MPEISKTVDQALTVLLTLSDNPPMNQAEIARAVGLNRTVVHRLLTTLMLRGFIGRNQDGYVPGAVLLRLSERVQPELRNAALPVMRELVDDVNETVVLHVPDGLDAVVLHQAVCSHHVVRVQHIIGSRHPIAMGASGWAMLCHQPESVIRRALASSDDADGARSRLREVREQGYALSHDELQFGVYGLAVPVLETSGQAAASLAILVPTSRATHLTDAVGALKAAAERISQALSGATMTS